MEIIFMFVALMLGGIGVIAYDKRKYRKHYNQSKYGAKFIFLRSNTPEVRNKLESAGIKLCPCAYNFTNPYLYTANGGALVCGFCEPSMHIIADAKKCKVNIVDCGVDIQKFIDEIKKDDSV